MVQRELASAGLLLLLLGFSLGPLAMHAAVEVIPPSQDLADTQPEFPASAMQADFNGTGWTFTGGGWDSNANEVVIDRPSLSWSAPSGSPQFPRSSACLFPVPERGELWLVGGIVDPSSQWNDEMETSLIEIYDIANSTWTVGGDPLPNLQSHAGCARHGDELIMVGDLPKGDATSTVYSDGMVQRYNLSTDTWSEGSNMPAGRNVGAAGYATDGGIMYVAGGVNRTGVVPGVNFTSAYDIVNDSWTVLPNLSTPRIAPAAAVYRGQLYVMGGLMAAATSWGGIQLNPMNTTEAYDPNTATWSNQSDLGVAIAGSSAHVIHDEIVLMGGYASGGSTRYTYGYIPDIDAWRQMGDLGQAALFRATTMYLNQTWAVGGDANLAFGGWHQLRTGVDRYTSPPTHVAVGMSPAFDLRTAADGQSILRWIRLAAQEPSGTDLGIQYRTSTDAALLPGAEWLPRTQGLLYTFGPGNHSIPSPSFAGSEPTLSELRGLHTWVQFRLELVTSRGDTWTLPTLDEVAWGMDEMVFSTVPRSQWQPFGPHVELETIHDLSMDWSSTSLVLDAGFGRVQRLLASEVAGAWSLSSPENDLNMVDVDRSSISVASTDPLRLAWNLSLGQGAMGLTEASYHLEVHDGSELVFAAFPSSEVIEWSDRLEVDMEAVGADGRDLLAPGRPVVAANQSVEVNLDLTYPVGGNTPTFGLMEARLHLAVEGRSAGQFIPTTTWFNLSGPWIEVDLADPQHLTMVLPSNASGPATLRLEVRTEANLSLEQPFDEVDFVLDAQVPTLIGSSPTQGAYTNLDANRNVVLSFAEVGGFAPEDVEVRVWVEDVDDGSDGSAPDGVASMTEYRSLPATWTNSGTVWSVNFTVDDSLNADHQRVLVQVIGSDLAGLNVPAAMDDVGHLEWTTRIPRIAVVEHVDPSGSGSRLLEPGQPIAWTVEVSDGNGLEDLLEVRLELGGDSGLGLRWDVTAQACQNLDGRTAVEANCTATQEGNVLRVHFAMHPTWSFVSEGLVGGLLTVDARDADGTGTWSEQGAWILSRELDFDEVTFIDAEGAVTGNVDGQHPVAVGEHLTLNASVIHTLTETPYSGALRIAWFGQVGPSRWDGGASVLVVDGVLTTQVPTPLGGGLLQAARFEIWDPQDTVLLHRIDLPDIAVDEDAPFLAPIDDDDRWSRYHLDEVEVGVNIEEDTAWTGLLNVTCRVTSTEQAWPEVSTEVAPTGTLQGVVLFTATFDMSQVGDPETLDPEATLSCWASGQDDAGRRLVGENDLTPLDPWFTTRLSSTGPDLRLGEVRWTGDLFDVGSNVQVEVPVSAVSETIDVPFVVEVVLVDENGETPVVRREIERLAADEGVVIRGQFNVPGSSAQLVVRIDPDQRVLELDEEGNVWSTATGANRGGVGSIVVAGGGGLVILVALGALLMRRRGQPVEEVAKALPPSGEAKKPARGPPRGPPRPSSATSEKATDAGGDVDLGRAAAALAALTPTVAEAAPASQGELPVGTVVQDHTGLPGGGDYTYTTEGTHYEGGEGVGRWLLHPDGRFERLA